jgi:lipid-A-disaccharide synthase-like uncharacterized protein
MQIVNDGIGTYFSHIINALNHYIIGLLGQCLFMARFIVQWIHSERHQQSLIPVSFWYLSLIGGLIVLAYGLHKLDPVIILGQLPGTIVYSRNLVLIHRNNKK